MFSISTDFTALLDSVRGPCFQAEDGEDKPKKYQKADLGQPNKMYYNEEVGHWLSSAACCTLPAVCDTPPTGAFTLHLRYSMSLSS